MIILSWDIGIVNLAYCVLKYTLKNNKPTIKILDWDSINLIDDDNQESLLCCGLSKHKKNKPSQLCSKKSSYILETPTNQQYGFCGMHLGQSEIYWSNEKTFKHFVEPILISKNRCSYQKKDGTMCGNKSNYITRDKLELCNNHYKSFLEKKIKKYSPRKIKNCKASNYTTSELQIMLVKKLDNLSTHFAKLGVSEVIIENQPGRLGRIMKTISGTLFDYFIIRGYIDKVHGLDIKLVRFINPSNKLKLKICNIDTSINNKYQKYKMHKNISIDCTIQLLSDQKKQLQYLDLFKKKDDLCDCYLQGCYYLQYIKFKKC